MEVVIEGKVWWQWWLWFWQQWWCSGSDVGGVDSGLGFSFSGGGGSSGGGGGGGNGGCGGGGGCGVGGINVCASDFKVNLP